MFMDKYEKIKGPVIAGKSKKQEIENISNNHFFCVLFGTFIFFQYICTRKPIITENYDSSNRTGLQV